MDTPVKSVPPILTSSPNPLSQFEDSPIFNYINNLSPIKPLNSEQSFNLLGFASPKTPVTLPATNCPQKSKITSCHLSYPLKPKTSDGKNERRKSQVADGLHPVEFHAGEADYLDSHVGIATNELLESTLDACQSTNGDLGISPDGKQDYLDSGVVLKVASARDERAELSAELHDCISSDHGCDSKSDAVEYKSVSQTVDLETSPEYFIQENSENVGTFFDSNLALQEVQIGQTKAVGCRWEKMLVEAADQLLCDSPINRRDPEETDNIYVDSGTLSFMDNILQLSQESIPLGFSEEHDGAERHIEAGQASTSPPVADKTIPNTSADVDDKPYPEQQQMLPRRCLVFEMSGTHYRKLISDSGGTSFISEQSACTAVTSEKRLVSRKCKVHNFSSMQPGIGLHLNTLATNTRDMIIVKQELMTYKTQLIDLPCTTSSLHSTSSDPKPIDSALDLNPMGKELEPMTTKGKFNENACQSSTFTGSEELKQNSTKRKRSKSEIVREDETCKRCNCKRSKCLKLYCECFAAGLYCVEPCACQGCLNRPAFEETVLETRRLIEARNPLAFAPKVIRIPDAPDYQDEINSTPASARHKRGCNCKKSGCLKKYCECFQGGVGCSLSCRCEGCKNSFGQKDGENILLEETEANEDNSADVSFLEGIVKVDTEHQDPQVMPCSKFGSGLLQPCTMTIEDETAKEFKDDDDTVKSMCPNRKRVSPYLGPRHSPVRKFCRKLILRSIPSFPKLSEHRENGVSQEKPS